MEIKARYVLIGLFALAVIVAGFAFVYWLDTKGGIGKRTTYEVRFQHTVSGLLKGSGVLFNGIRVGEVTGLSLVPDQPKEVVASIAIDARTPVRADTQVSLEFQGLTGVAAITLNGGSANAPLLKASPGEAPLLVASEAAGQTMSEAARQTLARLDHILAENSNDIHTIVSNLSSFSEALGKNSGKVDGILSGLERMTGGGKGSGGAYDLSALAPNSIPAKPLDKQIVVPDVNALLTYDSERVLSQVDGGQLTGLGNAKWSDNLPKLMQARIVQSFENTGSLGLASRPVEGAVPDFQLVTEIRKFQIAPGPDRAAVAEISTKLVASDGHVAGARIFDETAPLASQEDADAAKALNEAFGKFLRELIPWTVDTVAGGAEKPQTQPQPVQPKRRGQARG
jgi:phospholipid/cholesterol/gamma-HCH transport system substrate-binding protein